LFIGKDLVDQFAENLRDSYKGDRFVYDGTEWPPNQPKAVVNVAVISHKGKRTQKELIKIVKRHKVGTPGVDELVSPTSPFSPATITKNIGDIFSADPTCSTSRPPERILIEGAPGIGKTVLVKEAAYKWAIGELLDDKRLLIVLYLRDQNIQSIRSLPELIKVLTNHDDEMFTHVNCFVTRHNGKDVGFLIDGFDEYPVEMRKKSFVYDLICGRLLSRSTVMVTSRPNASSSLLGRVHKRVEILGFAEEQRKEYIKASLKKKARTKLEEYLNLNPIINSLCYVPLHLSILLHLFEVGSLPKTLTELNELFILHTVYHYLENDLPGSITKIEKLPESILNVIIKLSEMAYVGLMQNKLVFTDEEVKKLCPEVISIKKVANGYGLLQAIQHHPYKKGAVGAPTSFNFLHFTMQEFLAAFYISTLPFERQLKMLLDGFWEDHLSFMWMMYVGITGVRYSTPFSQFVANQQQTSHGNIRNRKKGLHLFQCLLEGNNTEVMLPDLIPGLFTNGCIDLQELTLLPYNVLSITSFLAKSPLKWKSLNLENCHIGDTGMHIVKRFLCNAHYKEKTSSIENINLFGNDLTSLHDSYCSLIRNGYFKKFNFSKQNLSEKFVERIADAVAKSTTIQSINLSQNGFGINSAKAIATCLKVNSILETLDISDNCVGADGAKLISNALCGNTVLKHLNIAHNNICDEGAVAISKCLVHNSTLKEVNLSWNSISSKGVHQIVLSLSDWQGTKLLPAEDKNHDDLFDQTRVDNNVNTTLEVLNLSHNTIDSYGAQSLSHMLQSNSSLTKLDISYSGLSDDGVAVVADSIKDNTSLRSLNMSENNITSATKIVELLQCNQHLSTLNLQQFCHANSFAFSINILNSIAQSNVSLKWLGLPKSNEEWKLNQVIVAINQSRSSMNVDHIHVEYK